MATERYAPSLHVFILCASVVASPASANARPSADVVIELPASSKLGEPIEGARVTFDNSAAGDAIGYGPFIDLVIDATGADGAGAEEDDGVVFLGASHLGEHAHDIHVHVPRTLLWRRMCRAPTRARHKYDRVSGLWSER